METDFSVVVRLPAECSKAELDAFESLVKSGGEVNPHGLRNRIEKAFRLAWAVTPGGDVAGLAALKNPSKTYRDSAFQGACSREAPNQWEAELGWIFVRNELRKRGLATRLLKELFSGSNTTNVYATAREKNDPMLSILQTFGFVQSGQPYRSKEGDYNLVLYVKQA
jgi:ribosomal protein S18 acetylase RimI-like enzyme